MRLETYAIFMTSTTAIFALLCAVLSIGYFNLERDNDALNRRLSDVQTNRDRWLKWVAIQKGVIEKHIAYFQHAGLNDAFQLWCKEKAEPDPELVHKISEALGEKDEVTVEEATVEIVPDDKVVIIAPPRLLSAQ